MAASLKNLLSAEALEKIASVETEVFGEGAKRFVADDQFPTVRSSNLVDRFQAVFGDREYAAALCSQLVAIATIRRIENEAIETVFDSILGSMQLNGVSEATQEWYHGSRDSILTLLATKSVRLVAKTLNLSVDYSDLFVSGNVVTDIRPVFDIGRASVVGGIVSQNLRIHFVSGDGTTGEQELSFALDIDDVDKLIAELEKAKRKSTAAMEFLKKSLADNVFILGEDRYGFN